MAQTERAVERQNPQKQIVLFIDDDRKQEKTFGDPLSTIEDLEAKFIHPHDLRDLSDSDLEHISLVLADQFLDSYWGRVTTREFLERIRSKNPNLSVVEISYYPGPLVFENSIGVLDTYELGDEISENISSWPKTASLFIEKLKWEANYAFQEASMVDKASESAEKFVNTFTRLIDNFSKLSGDANFQKLIKLLESSEDQFYLAFIASNDIRYRKLFLHLSWQIIGHVTVEHPPEFYGMPLQRLKEIVTEYGV